MHVNLQDQDLTDEVTVVFNCGRVGQETPSARSCLELRQRLMAFTDHPEGGSRCLAVPFRTGMQMKWISAVSGLLVVAAASSPCHAMNAGQRAVFDGAKAAFASCTHRDGVHVLQQGKVVCLRGTINPAMFIALVKVRGEIASRPYVIVSGFGGYEDSAIDIVRLLEPFSPTAVVGDACASACAQFLFLLGHQRVMLHCADVAIHGGTESIEQILARNADDTFKENMISAKWRFEKFYADRGISMDMVEKPPADVQKKLDAGQIVFWPWTIDQLRAFGVQGIISENDPENVSPKDFEKVCIKPLPAANKSTGA